MSFWNLERIERLRRLCAEGKSASQAATELDGTRSQVMGKAHRMGLNFHSGIKSNPIIARKAAAEKRAEEKQARAWEPPKWSIGDPTEPVHIDESADAHIPHGQRKALLDLEPEHCRWPIGDPQKPDFAFCGGKRVIGISYCQEHAARAFVEAEPPKPRRSAQTRERMRKYEDA